MNRFFTLLWAASCLNAVGQSEYCLEGTVWDDELGGCVSVILNSADINNDGCVQLGDLLDLLTAYGDCDDDVEDCPVVDWSGQTEAWSLYGYDIYDNASAHFNAKIGRRLAVNGNGSIVAVGSGGGGTTAPAEVLVFQRSDFSWVQLGQSLVGEDSGIQAVDLNESGKTLVVGQYQAGADARGKVTVYQYNEETQNWDTQGEQIFGNPSEYLGEFVSLSKDGNTFSCDYSVAGNARATRVYEYDGSSWSQKGEDIVFENSGSSNHVVSDLNEDGTILAIGHDQFDGKGLVQVFSFSEGTWGTLGQGILGEDAGDYCGTSISLNPSGNVIAIGEPGSNVESTNDDPNWNDAGQARIFRLESDQWVQSGQDINGAQGADYFGYSVALSGDGESLAIGAPNSIFGEWTGYVKTYRWDNESWIEADSTIIGEGTEDYFGWAVALSTDKTTLVVGAPEYNDGFGYVRILSAEACLPNEESAWQCGDPVGYQGYDYETVQIGEQCWFAENLRSEFYANGDAILTNVVDSVWTVLGSGAMTTYGAGASFCPNYSLEFDCDSAWSVNNFGLLYNWYAAVDDRGLCPAGWHVSTDDDWKQMERHLGMSPQASDSTGWRGTDEGDKLKAFSHQTPGWNVLGPPETVCGFSALPAGYRGYWGSFSSMEFGTNFWTPGEFSSTSWHRRLDGDSNRGISRWYGISRSGFSIRCTKDAE